ncbi:MAG TPA: PH domain-containing protein [Firmicutes bacterium]|nr:PH domain-containing protein [Bacillota bacterium]
MNDQNRNGIPDEIEQPEEEFEWTERKRLLFFGLPFTFTTYTLSPKKLELKTGFFTTVINDILLYRVMDTTLSRNLLQKLFGLGSVQVVSSDKTHPNLCIHNIRNAKDFKEALDEQVERERLRMRFRTGEYIDNDGIGMDMDMPE